MSLVTESEFNNGRVKKRYTEKTIKPMVAGHPFIIVGNSRTLSCLKEDGFRTFDGFINEEYDTIDNKNLRMKAVLDEIDRLCSLSDKEISKGIERVRENIEYNQNYVLSGYKEMLGKTHEYIINSIKGRLDG